MQETKDAGELRRTRRPAQYGQIPDLSATPQLFLPLSFPFAPGSLTSPFMFQTVLKEVVDGTEGGIASLLMDFEGITVDSYSKPDAPFDINIIGAEFSVVLKSIQRAAQMLEAGDTAEVAIQAAKVTTLIRVLSNNYFIAFSLRPDGNLGKARYMLRTRAPQLLKELT